MSLDWNVLWPPILAGLLVLTTHVPLGRVVLARGIIFLDLAVAQIASLGVITAELLQLEQVWMAQACALASALAGAVLLHWLERRWPDIQEALIGVVFVLAASTAVLLLSRDPHGAEHIKDLLSGQLLWVMPAQLLATAVVYALLLSVWWWRRDRLGTLGFYLVFAVAVTVSVQLVGVYLVFASLILPALAVRGLPSLPAHGVAYAMGALAYGAAMVATSWYDLPGGPAVVWMLAVGAIIVGLWSRRS